MLNGALVRNLSQVGKNALVIRRGISYTETPPTVRMNVYKKFLIGGLACSSFFVVPFYVLTNIKIYNKSAFAKPEEE